jgi:adenylosuccinate lyase
MTSRYDTYTSPLAERNASAEMLRIWSPRHKFRTWRRIWLAVAEAQAEMGLPVMEEQVEEIRAHLDVTDDDMARAEEHERRLRHDVMAHVHALGDVCPRAKGIIHLGMTSQDVVCNADAFVVREAVRLISAKVARVQMAFGEQSVRWRDTPALGFTHYQPAQPTTVGRRAAQWAYDLAMAEWGGWPSYRGLKGATGTQASFLSLCNDDGRRVDELELRFMYKIFNDLDDPGLFESERPQFLEELQQLAEGVDLQHGIVSSLRMYTHEITGQTYPRVEDARTLSSLAGIASVLHKIATDIRLLCNRKELDEPFEDKQIGSSAMPYKRNPMRCERICGLSRFVMNLVGNAYDTASTQWLERTLDDSSNRRLSLPEAFLALDGALDLMHNVAAGLIVHEAMVRKNLMAELPFMATENILMDVVKAGGDRQEYHERIRAHAQAAGARVKDEGLENDLIERLKGDPAFGPPALKRALAWDGLMDPMRYVGRSVEQTERFLKEVVEPLREQYGEQIKGLGESGPRV